MAAQLSSLKQVGKEFQVVLIGASARDTEMFSRIFGVTAYRSRIYKLISINEASSAHELESAANCDIFIVNLLNSLAVASWQKLAALIPADKRKPVLKISKITPSSQSGAEFTISWPINPSKVLQSLDNYTIRHLHYYPEFEIGSEKEPCVTTVNNIRAIGSVAPNKTEEEREQALVKVLVADDSLAVRRQLKIEFDLMNAELESVADGNAAVHAAENQKFDIIFLDVVMPGIDGYSVCKNIRRTKLNKATPVIMLTSRSSNFDKLKGILAGCDTYLTKPINHSEFKSITEKHLNSAQAPDLKEPVALKEAATVKEVATLDKETEQKE